MSRRDTIRFTAFCAYCLTKAIDFANDQCNMAISAQRKGQCECNIDEFDFQLRKYLVAQQERTVWYCDVYAAWTVTCCDNRKWNGSKVWYAAAQEESKP